MYALSFDMDISEVKAHYGEPYNGAYYEIKHVLVQHHQGLKACIANADEFTRKTAT